MAATQQQHSSSRSSSRGAIGASRGRRARPLLAPRAANAQSSSSSSSSSSTKHAVVVGGGIGGLVCAAKLAQSGALHKVTLVEAGPTLGGRCTSVTSPEGFRWDTGPSLLLLPQLYADTFASLGSSLAAHGVELARVEPAAYRAWFPPAAETAAETATPASAGRGGGGTGGAAGAAAGWSSLDLLYDVQRMVQQLDSVEAGAGMRYLEWLADARKALVFGSDNFIARDFAGWGDLLDPWRLLPLLKEVNPAELLGGHRSRLAQRFRDPRIQALLSFQDLYVGLTPDTAPGIFSLLAATEITDGVWYPIGGFAKVVDALANICSQTGVDVRTSTRVTAIRSSAGAVTGVTLDDGSVLPASVVVANPDVSMSHGLCVDEPRLQTKGARLAANAEYSAGVIAFYWAVGRRLDALAHHNVFLSQDFERSWQRARSPDEFVRHPNFYLCCPSRTDPSAVPPGRAGSADSLMVLLPVANLQERGSGGGGDAASSYAGLVAAGRRRVLDTLAACGVELSEADITHEVVRDPVAWRDAYALEAGAAFGLSHGLNQLALLRPGSRNPDGPRGYYTVGASCRPGNGVPLVMLGGRMAADAVLADLA